MSLMIAQKYSRALLEAAEDAEQLDAVLAEVADVEQVIKTANLATFFSDVTYSDDKKLQVIRTLQEVSSELFKNFLETIIKNNRIALLPVIITEVRHQADQLFKISDVTVTSVVPLSDAQLSQIEKTVKAKFDLNEVTIKNSIDEQILGGVVINARGKIIDASIKSQLNKIAKSII